MFEGIHSELIFKPFMLLFLSVVLLRPFNSKFGVAPSRELLTTGSSLIIKAFCRSFSIFCASLIGSSDQLDSCFSLSISVPELNEDDSWSLIPNFESLSFLASESIIVNKV